MMNELLWALAKIATGIIVLIALAYWTGYQHGKASSDERYD